MANMVIPIAASPNVLAYLAYIWSQVGAKLTCKLYQNDVTPDKDTVIGDLTEATFSGYAPVTITGWNFGSVGLDAEDRAVTVGDNVPIFTHSGGATDNMIYGYYVVDNVGALMWVQRIDEAPVPIDAAGRFVGVNPLFTLRSQYEHA